MSNKFDVKFEEIKKIETKDLEYSNLTLRITGKSVSEVLVNTFRRIVLSNIPTYAFAPECMIFDKNTSIFNNDQMKVRLMQLPILKTKLNLSYLHDKYWLDVDYSKKDREKHPEEK